MKNDLHIKNGITIPENELEISASRSGGPGGQHVNKTSSRITIGWNVKNSNAITEEQKNRLLEKLKSTLTSDGYLIVHNNESRSQVQNKKFALNRLAEIIRNGLRIPKKRTPTKIPKSIQEARLKSKSLRSRVKKLRNKNLED